MATEKWALGAVNTWTTAFGTEFTTAAISNGNSIASSVVIDNTANLDMFLAVSILCASITPTGAPYMVVGIYPLHDNTTQYGDGRFGSSAAGTIGGLYSARSVPMVAAVGAQYGVMFGILIPPLKFKLVLQNSLGVATAASGNTCKYMTHNRVIV